MVAPPWPQFDVHNNPEVLDGQHFNELAEDLQAYSRMIVQYTLEYPLEKASGHYIRELAAFTNQFTTQYLEHLRRTREAEKVEAERIAREREEKTEDQVAKEEEEEEEEDYEDDDDEAHGAETDHDENDESSDDSSSTTTSVRTDESESSIEDVRQSSGSHSQMQRISSQVKEAASKVAEVEASTLDLTIKIRWDCCEFPYAKKEHSIIYREVQQVIADNSDPFVAPIKLAAVNKSQGCELEIHVYNIQDRTTLINNSESWLRMLRNGSEARMMESLFPVVARSVPAWVLPPSADIAKEKQVILAYNDDLTPEASIAYMGWLSGKPISGRKGGMLICFTDPRNANIMIENNIVLEGRRFVTQRYRPPCNIPQCTKCLAFGHSAPACRAEVFCSLCAGYHDKSSCFFRKRTATFRKCLNCGGSHDALSFACPKRKSLRSAISATQHRINRFYPIKQTVPEKQPARAIPPVREASYSTDRDTTPSSSEDELVKEESPSEGSTQAENLKRVTTPTDKEDVTESRYRLRPLKRLRYYYG